jgi:hypothetical protein
MLRSSSLLSCLQLALPFLLLTACATVPLPGRGGGQPTLKPPKPLMEGRGPIVVPKDGKSPSDRVKLETPAKGKASATPKGKPLSAAEVKTKLQEAEDKSQSARSLAQSAQTPEDWKLVAQQWTKAIALLKAIPTQKAPISTQIQQLLADAGTGLSRAQQAQSAPTSSGNEPIQLDRSKSGKSQGLIYGDTPSPSANPSASPSPNPSAKPSASPSPSPKN